MFYCELMHRGCLVQPVLARSCKSDAFKALALTSTNYRTMVLPPFEHISCMNESNVRTVLMGHGVVSLAQSSWIVQTKATLRSSGGRGLLVLPMAVFEG